MKLFGLLFLLITLALSAWLYTGTLDTVSAPETTDEQEVGGVAEILDSAKEAAQQLGTSAQRVTIYDGISVSIDATLVDLSGRGLSGSLKAEIRQLSSLHTLDISNNDFTGLPAEIGQLSQLKILNISSNPLTGLPRELANLQNLEVLDLQRTQYSQQDLDVIAAGLPATTVILK